jgi:transcriptional regulator with PAS, ATPase and Fis domain
MIRQLRELINKVGPKDHARVVIRGETGTGKETVALQLHFKSPRKQEPFIAANCATLNPQLLVSQLFGHEKGSFTGASSLQRGCFEEANGGTLFLDEVGELPLEAQAGLLRVLQEGRFYRLGGTKEIKVDVRVIAATNRNLTDMVKKGEFRDDLFHRLNMVPIHITPLRERPEDISMIANAFWMNQHRERLTDKQIYALQNYDWPGNVRELHNILNLADIFEEEDFDKLIEENRSQWENNDRAEKTKRKDYPENLQEIIREHVQKILKKYDGNISRTANAMGITRNTLKKYMN